MPPSAPTQLTLGVSLDDDARFENFLIGADNRQLVDRLRHAGAEAQLIYLWGPPGSGLTHLLQALCHEYSEQGLAAIYLPMRERGQFEPAILNGADTLALVCIDDVEAVAGEGVWEQALFSAFNAVKDSDTRLVLASRQSPQQLSLELADLDSRLRSALVYQLREPDDDDKLALLRLRADKRGIGISPAVADFILLRSERSVRGLMRVLDQLDESSLRQKRRLTIPLVKSTLGW